LLWAGDQLEDSLQLVARGRRLGGRQVSLDSTERSRTAGDACVFYSLPGELRLKLRNITDYRTYPPGVTVVSQGDAAHGIFTVRSGAVRLLHMAPGGKMMAVRMVSAAGILGLPEVTSGTPYQFTAQTVDECLLEYAPRKAFVAFLLEHPQVAVELLIWLSQEFQDLQQSLCEAVTDPDLEHRLLNQLRELSQTCGSPSEDGVELRPRLTGQDLADGLGCSRQWISKLLGDLEHRGMIKRRARRIIVTPEAFAAGDHRP
jgi:CRP/FNR family transcriptional regulator, cyclic AMP receptor protein